MNKAQVVKSLILRTPRGNIKQLHPKAQEKRAQYSQEPQKLLYNSPSIDIPFKVCRTQNGNLPIYRKYHNRSPLPRTVIRHIEGDVQLFVQELRKVCSNADVKEKIGRVEVNGSHMMSVKKWFENLGF